MKHIIDVRTSDEFQYESNPMHTNIPFDELIDIISKNELPVDDEYSIVCRTGNRSGIIVEIMKSKGFNIVSNGGAWNSC